MKEIYDYIEKNTFDIKSCITNYISYILGATLFSGLIGNIFTKNLEINDKCNINKYYTYNSYIFV